MKIKKIVLDDNTEIMGRNIQIIKTDKAQTYSSNITFRGGRNKTGKFLSDVVNPRSNVSSKRITAIFLVLVAVSTYILDSLQMIIVNSEICIWILSGGIVLLTSTAVEKFAPTNFKLFDQPSSNHSINDREETYE